MILTIIGLTLMFVVSIIAAVVVLKSAIAVEAPKALEVEYTDRDAWEAALANDRELYPWKY